MKMLKIGDKYQWKNPYTKKQYEGIVIEVNKKNETMKIQAGIEIFQVGS